MHQIYSSLPSSHPPSLPPSPPSFPASSLRSTTNFPATVMEYHGSFHALSPSDVDQLLVNSPLEECAVSVDSSLRRVLEVIVSAGKTRCQRDLGRCCRVCTCVPVCMCVCVCVSVFACVCTCIHVDVRGVAILYLFPHLSA